MMRASATTPGQIHVRGGKLGCGNGASGADRSGGVPGCPIPYSSPAWIRSDLVEDLMEVGSRPDNRLKAAVDVFKERLVRREVPLKALHEGPMLPAAKGTVKQTLNINRGISDDKGREIAKFVKGLGLKIQTQIQG